MNFTDLTMAEYAKFCNEIVGADMPMTTKEMKKDDMEAACRFNNYVQGRKTWSNKEQYLYAMSAARWAKCVRDKVETVIDYWIQQQGTYPDQELLEYNMEETYTLLEDRWVPIVGFWIREWSSFSTRWRSERANE